MSSSFAILPSCLGNSQHLDSSFFFFNDTATTEIYTLSLHDALPIYLGNEPVNIHKVGELVRTRMQNPQTDAVFLRCDETVPFGSFATVVDELRQSGSQNVSVVTEPISSRPRTR